MRVAKQMRCPLTWLDAKTRTVPSIYTPLGWGGLHIGSRPPHSIHEQCKRICQVDGCVFSKHKQHSVDGEIVVWLTLIAYCKHVCIRLFHASVIFSSFQEWANAMARRPSSVRPSVCKLLRKSLLLAGKWPYRHQTCTRWSPGKRASRVCLRSRSRSKVT